MRRRDILAKMAADAADRARQELARRVEGVVDRITGRETVQPRPGPARPRPTRVEPTTAPEAPTKPEPSTAERPRKEDLGPPPEETVAPEAATEGPPRQSKGPPRGAKPKPATTSSKAPDAPKAPKAPKAPQAEPSGEPGADQIGTWGERAIQDALDKLRKLQDESAQLAKQLEERGAGEAARALLGLVERAETSPPPPTKPRPIAPIAEGAAPSAPPAPPAPPALPERPEVEEPIQRGDDSLALQGSRFHIPLGSRLQTFKILWDEWIRAGIGKERGIAGIGEVDDAGRPRGPVLSDDELRYLPRAEVVVPGRDGSLLIPPEIMVDFDKFEQMLDQWGVGERITIVVEGMVRSEGPVAKNTWYAGLDE